MWCRRDQPEIVNIARKLDEMGFKLYATERTAQEISRLGTDVEVVGKLGQDNRVFQLLEDGNPCWKPRSSTSSRWP